MRRILSAFLALVLVVSVLGTAAFAAEAESNTLTVSLECYMPAMGGCDLAENIVKSAAYVDNADGTTTITVNFYEVGEWSSAYFSGQTTYVEDAGQLACYNGSEWVDAAYTTATASNGEGSKYTYVSSMTFTVDQKAETYDLAMTMSGYQFGGSDPSTVSSGDKMTATLTVTWSEEDVAQGDTETGTGDDSEDEDIEGETGATTTVPGDSTDTIDLVSGCYAVDISWSPMASMFAPILEINADAMTFEVYNQSVPETSKGAGTVSFADGVYTLTYENGNTTTFTYADGVITFTSKLWYGTASFNQTDDNGNFISYTATLVVEEGEDSESANIAGTYEGTYTYQPTGMPTTLMYSFTMELNEDGTYSFECMYGTDETYSNAGLSETGTYTVQGSTITVTNTNGDSWTGTVNADGAISMNRPLTAAMSGKGYGSSFDILLTPVSNDETPEQTVPGETRPEETTPETTVPEETTPETTAPEETEPPKSTVISVTSLSDLEPGTYKLTAELDCYMSAMGGCQFGGVLKSAYLIVAEDGSASVKLYFYGDAELTMMYGTTTICVNPNMETSYWNGSQWVNASYTTATATDEEGAEYTYVSSMTFPISKVQDTYQLGLGFGGGSMGAQFGGNSAQMLSNGSVLEAVLTINWAKTYTNPATGDEANVIPFVVMMVLSACGIVALVAMKKRQVF